MSADPFARGAAPRPLASPVADVALSWIALDVPSAVRERLAAWLSPAERDRMARFGSEALRHRYAVGRGTLRWLLARALDAAPDAIAIERGTRGRPWLPAFPGVDFNVTHTGERGMVGIARGTRIGVDVERVDRVINAAGVARKFMTARERAALPTDTDAARQAILQRWTCKEAMSKATGDGVSAPFGRIDVELAPSPRLAGGPPPYDGAQWRLHAVEADGEHFAALALWDAPLAARDGGSP